MDWKPIKKAPWAWVVLPNLEGYPRARAASSWEDIGREHQGVTGGGGAQQF